MPEGDWSAGYAFRQIDGLGGILLISSNGAWLLTNGTEQVRAAGLVENLNTDPGSDNTVELIAAGETGYLTVNGEFAAQLDLSLWTEAGSLSIIGTVAGDGTPLEVFDATVWTLGEAQEPEGIVPTPTASPVPDETEIVEESPVATEEGTTPEATVESPADEAAAYDEIVASIDGARTAFRTRCRHTDPGDRLARYRQRRRDHLELLFIRSLLESGQRRRSRSSVGYRHRLLAYRWRQPDAARDLVGWHLVARASAPRARS